MDLGGLTFNRQSAHDILSATLPNWHGDRPNQLHIEQGACSAAITELVKTFDTLEIAKVKPAVDIRVVFVFTRVDGFSVLLGADDAGQFEWANIKRELPTLEQRKALWKTLPYEVVEQWPGPLKEQK